MNRLDNKTMKGMERELEEEVRGLKPAEKRRVLCQCADYLLGEDKIPQEIINLRNGYSP